MDLTVFDQFLRLFMEAATRAVEPLETAASGLLTSLLWITVFWGGAQIVAGHVSDNAIVRFLGWFFRLWLVCFIAANWFTVLQALMEGMIGIGAAAGGMSAADFMLVSRLMRTGYRILDPIWEHQQALCTGPWSCAVNFWDALKYEVAWYLVFFSFVYMCWQSIAAQVQFMFHGLATLFVLPTAAIPQLAWISERGIGGVIANGIYLMVLPLVLGIGMVMFDLVRVTADLTVNQALMMAVISIFMALTVYKAKEIGDGVVNGGPSLSGNSLASGVAAGVLAATGIGRMAMAGAAAANGLARTGNRALWGAGAGAGVANAAAGAAKAGGRVAGAAASGPFGGGGAGPAPAGPAPVSAGTSGGGGAGVAGVAGAAGGGPFARMQQAQQRMQAGVHRAGQAVQQHGVAGLATMVAAAAGRSAMAALRHHGGEAAGGAVADGGDVSPSSSAAPVVATAGAAAAGMSAGTSAGGSAGGGAGGSNWHPSSGVPSGALSPADRHRRWMALQGMGREGRARHAPLAYSYQAQWEYEQSTGAAPYGPPPPPLQHPEHLAKMAQAKRYSDFAIPSQYAKRKD